MTHAITYPAGAAHVSHADGLFARIEAAGADIVQEPMDQVYGLRDCAVRDPAGNLIRIQQRP